MLMSTSRIFILIEAVLSILLIVIPLLIAVAYFTPFERKVTAPMQRRRGPNVVGSPGPPQPLADGLKLLLKETVLPSSANLAISIAAPIVTFMLSLTGSAVMPFEENMVFVDMSVGTSHISAVPPSGAHGTPPSGRASNPKHASPGASRPAAQMAPYEVPIGPTLTNATLRVGPPNLTETAPAQKQARSRIPPLPLLITPLIPASAETNRHPSDPPEAEAESVAGYFVEYSAMGFALFFSGESANIPPMCALTVVFSPGG